MEFVNLNTGGDAYLALLFACLTLEYQSNELDQKLRIYKPTTDKYWVSSRSATLSI